jgi:hypothetical protein
MSAVANHNLKQDLEVELWLKELAFLNDQINFMKRHLPEAKDHSSSEEILNMIDHFSESFSIQKKWLHRMKLELERISMPDEDEWQIESESIPSSKMFSLQMQANRMVNEELKDNFFKFLVKWM